MLAPSPLTIWIASFDIGKVNFCFMVEEVPVDSLSKLTASNIPLRDRYNRDGTHTPEFAGLMREVCATGKVLLIDNVNLTLGVDNPKNKILDPQVLVNMYAVLDKYKSAFWDRCSVFLIEQQMSFGKNRNTMALKLGQHCFSYFIFQYAGFKDIVEFPAYHKTRVLGARRKMTKPERKKWAIAKAAEILEDRSDSETLTKIGSRKKKDDMSDVIVQLQAYKYMTFVDV